MINRDSKLMTRIASTQTVIPIKSFMKKEKSVLKNTSHLEYTIESNRQLISNGFGDDLNNKKEKSITINLNIDPNSKPIYFINNTDKSNIKDFFNSKEKFIKNEKKNKLGKSHKLRKIFFKPVGKADIDLSNIKSIKSLPQIKLNATQLKSAVKDNSLKNPKNLKLCSEYNNSNLRRKLIEKDPPNLNNLLHSSISFLNSTKNNISCNLKLSEVLKKNPNLDKSNILGKLSEEKKEEKVFLKIPWNRKNKIKLNFGNLTIDAVDTESKCQTDKPSKKYKSEKSIKLSKNDIITPKLNQEECKNQNTPKYTKKKIEKKGTIVNMDLETINSELSDEKRKPSGKEVVKQENSSLAKNDTLKNKLRRNNTLIMSHDSFIDPKIALFSRQLMKKLTYNNSGSGKGIIKYICGKSTAGVNEDGTLKINQDCYLSRQYILGLDFSIFSVLDGHGSHGHFISVLVKNAISTYFSNEEKYHSLIDAEDDFITDKVVYSRLTNNNYEMIKEAHFYSDHQISISKFETNFSGTTAVTVFQIGNKIICANVGDSRAVMVVEKKVNNIDTLEAIPLSSDHKPDIPKEKERILKHGGRIEKLIEDGEPTGPYRIWFKNENFPGICVSRCLGDFIAKKVGVICEPEILEFEITKECKFFLLASDGLWEYLTHKKIIEIVNYYYKLNDCNKATDKLIEEAISCWKKEDNIIDDITVVLVFI